MPQETCVTRGHAGTAVKDGFGHTPLWRVFAGFAQQNAIAAARGKSIGKDGACRSAADDDVVKPCGQIGIPSACYGPVQRLSVHMGGLLPELRPGHLNLGKGWGYSVPQLIYATRSPARIPAEEFTRRDLCAAPPSEKNALRSVCRLGAAIVEEPVYHSDCPPLWRYQPLLAASAQLRPK